MSPQAVKNFPRNFGVRTARWLDVLQRFSDTEKFNIINDKIRRGVLVWFPRRVQRLLLLQPINRLIGIELSRVSQMYPSI